MNDNTNTDDKSSILDLTPCDVNLIDVDPFNNTKNIDLPDNYGHTYDRTIILNDEHFKFNEQEYVEEFLDYLRQGSMKYYNKEGEAIEPYHLMVSRGNAIHFCIDNIIKYSFRCGKKDSEATRKELMKIMHYATLALYALDNTPKQ